MRLFATAAADSWANTLLKILFNGVFCVPEIIASVDSRYSSMLLIRVDLS